MSYVRFNISDRDGAVSGDLHGSMTEPMIAALTAEPETIAEFESALHRYIKSESDWPPLHGFRKHEDLEPYDAGIVAIDLPSRTVGYESTYSYPRSEGDVRVPSEFAEGEEDVYVPYRLPDDWEFVGSMPAYKGARLVRGKEHLRWTPFDARPILFGRPMINHIARAVSEAFDLNADDLFADIHASWLMTERAELRGRTPREVLLEKQDFISFDMHTRSLQWSFTKVCPPPLAKDSFAYLNAGFGTHENVVYYDLFRHLLSDAAYHRAKTPGASLDTEIERLSSVRDGWLRVPDPEMSGRVPLELIEYERRRMNITMSAREAIIDENCPCCVAMAEDFDTPMFWGLDGSHMDDRFEFSFHKTLEEWDAEKRRWEEFNRDFEAGKYKWPEDDDQEVI